MIKTSFRNNEMDIKQEIVYLSGNNFRLTRVLKRGDIVGIDFGINTGREKSGLRPAVVISDASANVISENIIVAPITSYANKIRDGKVNLRPSQFILSKKFYRQLNSTSIVQIEDIRSVSKKRISNFLGDLSQKSLDEMNQCIKNTLTF